MKCRRGAAHELDSLPSYSVGFALLAIFWKFLVSRFFYDSKMRDEATKGLSIRNVQHPWLRGSAAQILGDGHGPQICHLQTLSFDLPLGIAQDVHFRG